MTFSRDKMIFAVEYLLIRILQQIYQLQGFRKNSSFVVQKKPSVFSKKTKILYTLRIRTIPVEF